MEAKRIKYTLLNCQWTANN